MEGSLKAAGWTPIGSFKLLAARQRQDWVGCESSGSENEQAASWIPV
jgi:hypothetical protein